MGIPIEVVKVDVYICVYIYIHIYIYDSIFYIANNGIYIYICIYIYIYSDIYIYIQIYDGYVYVQYSYLKMVANQLVTAVGGASRQCYGLCSKLQVAQNSLVSPLFGSLNFVNFLGQDSCVYLYI